MSFVDESGPAAMQHGNSARNLQPLQIFQKTGKMVADLNSIIFSPMLRLKTTSVNILAPNNEDIKLVSSIRPIAILLIVVTQLLFHLICQRSLMSSSTSLEHNSSFHATQNYKIAKHETKKVINQYHLKLPYKQQNNKLQAFQADCESSNAILRRWSHKQF